MKVQTNIFFSFFVSENLKCEEGKFSNDEKNKVGNTNRKKLNKNYKKNSETYKNQAMFTQKK